MKTINHRNEDKILRLLRDSIIWAWILATGTAGILLVLGLLVSREYNWGTVAKGDYMLALGVASTAWILVFFAIKGTFFYGLHLLYGHAEHLAPKEEKYNKWNGEYPPLPHQPEWVQVLKQDGQYVYKLKSDIGVGGNKH